jgi:hypothetical protein
VFLLRYDRAELVEHPKAYLFRMATNLATEWALRARSRHPHDARIGSRTTKICRSKPTTRRCF